MENQKLVPPHGGYRKLKSYQTAEIVYDFTAEFCKTYITPNGTDETNRSYRMAEQMVQAARSGKQNIVEGSMASPEAAANCAICLIHQTNFLLDKQLQSLEKEFLEQGGFTERLYWERRKARARQNEVKESRAGFHRSDGTNKSYK
ncbi:MAG: four helix bundle suffix domain-containing protein [Patescibacteria group bacterium]|nr:four helix bundle suffix domain-containing protein [Patescibacteria group bacterium]